MNKEQLIALVKEIVLKASELKNRYPDAIDAPVNYACIFTHSDEEFFQLSVLASELGTVIKDTPTGPLFHIQPLKTCAGILKLLKIRKHDEAHKDLGDADFTLSDYLKFKAEHLDQEGFKLMVRPDMEMIELMDKNYPTRAYFSYPPLDKQLDI